jgi:hypothetical protein
MKLKLPIDFGKFPFYKTQTRVCSAFFKIQNLSQPAFSRSVSDSRQLEFVHQGDSSPPH